MLTAKEKQKVKGLFQGRIDYCDVGARWGVEEPWKSFEDFIQTISFEPDQEEYENLKENSKEGDLVISTALWSDIGEKNLFLTKSRGCSSFYRPNKSFLDRYPDAARFDIEETVKVDVTTLDELKRKSVVTNIDFLKIDVQGAELDVLKGATSLDGILGMQLEVEFQPIYEGQALFSDVDSFVRDQFGLELQDLRKAYWKYPAGVGLGGVKGALEFGDALYFRSPESVVEICVKLGGAMGFEKFQKACLLGVIYGYLDYTMCILEQEVAKEIVDAEEVEKWRDFMLSYGRNFRYAGRGVGRIWRVVENISGLFRPTYGGWAASGEHIGNRKSWMGFY